MGGAKASLEAAVRYLAANLGPRGIRVNGISAGPIKTLAAAGIPGHGNKLKVVAEQAPAPAGLSGLVKEPEVGGGARALGGNVTIDEVGNVAAFLLSDLAAAVT